MSIIKEARISDLNEVREVLCNSMTRCGFYDINRDISFEINEIEKGRKTKKFYVAEKDNRVAGYMSFDTGRSIKTFKRVNLHSYSIIDWLVIDSDYSNNGIGTELVGFAETESREKAVSGMVVFTYNFGKGKYNPIEFYENLGFEVKDEYDDEKYVNSKGEKYSQVMMIKKYS